jgi:hypothetical protein
MEELSSGWQEDEVGKGMLLPALDSFIELC